MVRERKVQGIRLGCAQTKEARWRGYFLKEVGCVFEVRVKRLDMFLCRAGFVWVFAQGSRDELV